MSTSTFSAARRCSLVIGRRERVLFVCLLYNRATILFIYRFLGGG